MAPTPQQQDYMVFLISTKTTCLSVPQFQLVAQKHITLPNSSVKFFKITLARFHPLLKIVQISSRKINSKIATCTNFTNVCKIPIEKFMKFLEFTNTNCIAYFNKKFYKQLQGEALGSPVSPVIANIYMEHIESLAIPTSPTLIKWGFRYVDDVHSAIRKYQVNKHQEHLNSIDPHIKFTIELQGIDGIPFLDNLAKTTPNSIESTIYRKPTHTDRYLDYKCNNPISAKLSVIHILLHRTKQVCSTPEFSQKLIFFTKSYTTTTT